MSQLPSQDIDCPYCGEVITVMLDESGGEQRYIEDCQVCCRPINLHLWFDDEEVAQLSASAENEV
jgi:hypothetical protein